MAWRLSKSSLLIRFEGEREDVFDDDGALIVKCRGRSASSTASSSDDAAVTTVKKRIDISRDNIHSLLSEMSIILSPRNFISADVSDAPSGMARHDAPSRGNGPDIAVRATSMY